MDKQYSVKFFTLFVEAMQKFCREYIEFDQCVELSGYLAVEIDNHKKERYVLSEMLQSSGNVISESYCTKAFKTLQKEPPVSKRDSGNYSKNCSRNSSILFPVTTAEVTNSCENELSLTFLDNHSSKTNRRKNILHDKQKLRKSSVVNSNESTGHQNTFVQIGARTVDQTDRLKRRLSDSSQTYRRKCRLMDSSWTDNNISNKDKLTSVLDDFCVINTDAADETSEALDSKCETNEMEIKKEEDTPYLVIDNPLTDGHDSVTLASDTVFYSNADDFDSSEVFHSDVSDATSQKSLLEMKQIPDQWSSESVQRLCSRVDNSPVYTCDMCNKGFHYRHVLIRHIQCVHHGGSSFFCNVCGAKFNRKDNLNRHSKSHRIKKPQHCGGGIKQPRSDKLWCQQCNKRFTYKSALTRHNQNFHFGSVRLRCTVCNGTFSRKDYFRQHLKRHVKRQ